MSQKIVIYICDDNKYKQINSAPWKMDIIQNNNKIKFSSTLFVEVTP